MKVTEGLERIRAFFPGAKMFASSVAVTNTAVFEEVSSRLHLVALERPPGTARECVAIMDKCGVGVRNGVISLD